MFFAPKIKLLRSSAFRLALVYMALFALSVLVLLGFIYWSTVGYMVRQTEATIRVEIVGLAERYNLAGLQGLSQVITERLTRKKGGGSIYLIADSDYKPLLGNLKNWPIGAPIEEGWITFRVGEDLPPDEKDRPVLARTFMLSGGYNLLVGRDVRDLEKMQEMIIEALIWGLVITVLLALAGGMMMSRALVRRLDAINLTCRQIMAGDLSRRIRRKGSDDEFDQLVDNLNAMLDQIEELMQSIRQVSNSIAHDLRTPLSRLRSRLERLKDEGVDEDREAHLERAIAEADGLLTTFRAMLRISEVESGSRRAGFVGLDLVEVLEDLAELYGPLCEDKGLTFECRLPATRPMCGDRDLLFQAFANVLDNALKYTPASGRVGILLEGSDTGPCVTIDDSGPGIPPELREKVFERFFRVEASRSTPGNGLGLSLVAAVVKLHQGQVSLDDNQPGLRVKIKLTAA